MKNIVLTAQQEQHINKCICAHNVEYLTYNGNYLGWHHCIEFPSDLFPEFNEDMLEGMWDFIRSYQDEDIKYLKFVHVKYDQRRLYVDFYNYADKLIYPLCPTSLINNIYREAEEMASEWVPIFCKTTYEAALKKAHMHAEDDWLNIGRDEISKLVPYDQWLDLFLKKLINTMWSDRRFTHSNESTWITDPPLPKRDYIGASVIEEKCNDDLPF